MSISKYNNEGYPDPTAFGALSSIENETQCTTCFQTNRVYLLSLCRRHRKERNCCQSLQPLCSGARIYPHCTTPAVSTVFERQRPERT